MNTPRLTTALAVLTLLFTFGSTQPMYAQPVPGIQIGLGGQIGDPSGLSFKFYEQPGLAWDFLLAFDLEGDYVFFNAHRVWEQPFPDTPLRYFYGPGALIGSAGPPDGDNELLLGISFTIGLNYFIKRFEIYGNLTPRLAIIPATEGAFGGGVGLRYYF